MTGRQLVKTDGQANLPATSRGSRQTKFLAQSIILEEGGNNVLVRSAIYLVCGVVAAFIAWSAMVDVDEVATAFGQVIPAGKVQTIQHLEGGIVNDIMVKEGTLVEAGQPLIRLDPASALAELDQARARKVALELQSERLRAFGMNRAPEFASDAANFPEMLADQQSIYDIQKSARADQYAVLTDQIEQRKAELDQIDEEEKTLKEQLEILTEELDMRGKLVKKGLSSKILYFNVKRDYNEVKGELAKLMGERRRALQALQEVKSRQIEQESRAREDALSIMGSVIGELAQVQRSIAKLEDRVKRLVVRAPVRGIVKGLKVHTVGGVIPAGGQVLDIVPVDEEMVVEAKINPRDVGHIHLGQPVQVKVTTYDFARYGGITGVLESVSATTFVDEAGDPYYKGMVRLDRSYVGHDPTLNQVLPGMTVQADINTGKKTLLQYFLKPIYSSIDSSFRER